MSSRSTGVAAARGRSPASLRASTSRSSTSRCRPIDLLEHAALRRRPGRRRSGWREVDLELGPHPGERAAQLVGGVGDEALLPCGSARSSAVEHRVHRRGQPGDLVVAAGTGTRRSRSRPPIAATSARIGSTGRSVRPTSTQISAASTPATSGTATRSDAAASRRSRRCRRRAPPTWTTTGPSGVVDDRD